MKRLDKNDPERDKETKFFDPSLFYHEQIEHSASEDQKTEDSDTMVKEGRDEELNREKTEAMTKEAMLRVTSGVR